MAMTGSPAMRDTMDSTGRSLRPLRAPASSPAATSTARPATARYAGRSQFCLHFGFTQRDVIRVPTDRSGQRQLSLTYIQNVTPFGRTCQPGTASALLRCMAAVGAADHDACRLFDRLDRGGE